MKNKTLVIVFLLIISLFSINLVSAFKPIAVCYDLSTGRVCINSSFGAPTSYLAQAPHLYLVGNTFNLNTSWLNANFANATIFNTLSGQTAADNVTQAFLINQKLSATATICGVGNVSKYNGTGFECVDSASGGGTIVNNITNNITVINNFTNNFFFVFIFWIYYVQNTTISDSYDVFNIICKKFYFNFIP